MKFKSNYGEAFKSQFAENLFLYKYKHDKANSWPELADTLVEEVCQDYLSKDDKWQLKAYIRDMLFIPGGRYLYYAGRQKKYYNNCYLLRCQEDSREDWADLSWKSERCLTVGGGIGSDYSIYRPRGSYLHGTGGVASGPVSKMRMINEIGREVIQGGSRRSAIYASLNWKHQDIQEFLHAKDWDALKVAGTSRTFSDVRKEDFNFPCPLDMTNISVNYDTEWLLKYWKTGELNKVFLENCKQAMRTGEPGFSFNFFNQEKETLRNACVTGDTLLLTEEGYYPISQLVGKEIKTWNGEQWSSVVPFYTGKNPILKIIFSDGTQIKCTPYHKFILSDGTEVCADELSPNDKLAKIDMPLSIEGKEYDIDAYSQGFYSGDGSRDYKRSHLYWTKFCCKDRLVGEFKKQQVEDRITWIHGEMFPKEFVPINGSLQFRLNWLAGICDSDGTVTRDDNGNGIQITSINKQFLLDIKLMLSRMGVRAKVVDGNIEAGLRWLPDGKGNSAEYWCQQNWRLLIGNQDTYYLTTLGFKTERLAINDNPPQRDARRFIKVLKIIDTTTIRKTYCVTEPLLHRMTINGIVTGNCTEVTSEDDSDVCNLGSINLARISSISEFADVVDLATKFLLLGTLVAELPYDKVYQVREKNRRLGLGLMGYHEWLLQRNYRYEVPEEMHRWLDVYRGVSRDIATNFSHAISISNPVACRAIAPTGSIGILASTTTGIEPVYAVAIKRRYLKGAIWKYQYVVDEIAKTFIEDGYNPDSIESSVDLAKDYKRRLSVQSNIQDYVDMSISSTINMPNWGSELNNEDKVLDFAKTLGTYAHRLRGFTVYPDGARGGQPLVSVPYNEAVDKLGIELEENTEHFDVCEITGKGGYCGT